MKDEYKTKKELIVDITRYKQAEEELKHRLELERTIKGISSRFIGEYQFDDAVNESLRELGYISAADRVYLFRIHKQNNTISNTHEWCSEGVAPQMNNLQDILKSDLPWWMGKLYRGEIIQINDVTEMPVDAEIEKRILESQDIKSLLVLPVYNKASLTGFIGFDYVKETNILNNEDLNLLGIASEIIGRAIEHYEDEVALWQSEYKYRSLFTNSASALLYCQSIVNLKGYPVDYRVLEVNKAFEEMTGVKAESVVWRTCRELTEFTGCLKDELLTVCGEVAIKGGKRKLEKRFGQKWFDLSIYSPKKGYFVVIFDDITEERQLREKLQNTNMKLIKTIRKLKIAQSQLVQKEKLAGIGQLAAGVAHEINNPLGFVMSNIETLKRYVEAYEEIYYAYRGLKNLFMSMKIDHPELQDCIKSILGLEQRKNIKYMINDTDDLFVDVEDGLKRIHETIRNLRLFSKVDFSNSYEQYNLNEGILNTLAVVNNEVKYCSKVQKNLSDIPGICANGSQINQVLLNIIINAVEAVKLKKSDEFGLINITTYNDGEFVYCEIEDNGTGIPEEDMDKIFNPFYTTKPVGLGTGLGLSISYDIVVNKHKGELMVQSIVGTGTKLLMKLPVKNPESLNK